MEMIIGGAFQGKSRYAREKYPEINWVLGAEASEKELFSAQGVLDFHKYIRREMEAGRSVDSLGERLAKENPQLVVVCDEVGYGVVPMDAFDRAYREAVGRVCTSLAAKSAVVTRVICGIGTVIKNA